MNGGNFVINDEIDADHFLFIIFYIILLSVRILNVNIMKIEHLAIWTEDLELLRQFYMKYFKVTCGEKYVNTRKNYMAHFSISVDGKDAVNALTERLREDGYTIAGEPRTTGDGYYESVVLDPEGNYIEISE